MTFCLYLKLGVNLISPINSIIRYRGIKICAITRSTREPNCFYARRLSIHLVAKLTWHGLTNLLYYLSFSLSPLGHYIITKLILRLKARLVLISWYCVNQLFVEISLGAVNFYAVLVLGPLIALNVSV